MSYNPEAVGKMSRDIAKKFKANSDIADVFVYMIMSTYPSADRNFLEKYFIENYYPKYSETLDYRDFVFAGNSKVDLYDLNVGEYFVEDTYPEVYRVMHVSGNLVHTFDLTDKRTCRWEYDRSYPAYAPTVYDVKFDE